MAAVSMGAFGAYKQAYSKYLKELEERERELAENGEDAPEVETVWVTKRYTPLDMRSSAPVPRHKLLAPRQLPAAERHWIPSMDPPLRSFERSRSDFFYKSHPATRCEDYSTLRQMLPSRGSIGKLNPPNWGTHLSLPPLISENAPRRFPLVNSPMTRYVDDMHLTNRLYKLH
ncbi:hypothetical protein MAR_002370 [Mya arenaria]|uniref:Uncharacterized protein n=1 Tax=Mya arenaria TaxID=6604 RepID=A0ABY7FHL7_MYAAR|nr:uncharacterized protein LOC128209417 [Mya arenaria]XP_052769408.1 uncharacterized protein LOC128209423 [Mya arenaria]WAR20532.1 hypothetical protein MAR_002370 [Mya arenaria]